jgi:hypothetical protein
VGSHAGYYSREAQIRARRPWWWSSESLLDLRWSDAWFLVFPKSHSGAHGSLYRDDLADSCLLSQYGKMKLEVNHGIIELLISQLSGVFVFVFGMIHDHGVILWRE